MKRYTLILVGICLALPTLLQAEEAPTLMADTLQRELVLQRDYVPTGQKAEKKLFNPLDQVSSGLSPIRFAHNSYALDIHHLPLLAQPVMNPLTPEAIRQVVHGRLVGGWPLYLGANLGLQTKVGTAGSLGITLDHLSQKNDFSSRLVPFPRIRETQDSEVGITYATPLWDRLFSFKLDGFYHRHTLHGIRTKDEYLAELPPFVPQEGYLPPKYNRYGMKGFALGLSLAPAPLSLDSRWLYSLEANLEWLSKEDYSREMPLKPALFYQATEGEQYDNQLSQLYLTADGHLGYAFAGTDWAFGVKAHFAHLAIPKLGRVAGATRQSLLLSAAPQVTYHTPTFHFQGGAKVELLNRGDSRILVQPDIALRWHATPLFSLYMVADGGTKYMGLRELYQQNRYASALSAYSGYNITAYRILLGGQVGNYNGFSLDLYAGYARHRSFGEWVLQPLSLPQDPTHSVSPLEVITFQRVDAGRTGETFVQLEAGYLSNFGLEISGQVRYSHYQRLSKDGAKLTLPIQGMPSFTTGLYAAYAFTPKLIGALDYTLMGGIQFYEEVAQKDATGKVEQKSLLRQLPWVGKLNASLSYDINKYIGVSLIGTNLLNRSNMRWAYYREPGAALLGAMTLKF